MSEIKKPTYEELEMDRRWWSADVHGQRELLKANKELEAELTAIMDAVGYVNRAEGQGGYERLSGEELAKRWYQLKLVDHEYEELEASAAVMREALEAERKRDELERAIGCRCHYDEPECEACDQGIEARRLRETALATNAGAEMLAERRKLEADCDTYRNAHDRMKIERDTLAERVRKAEQERDLWRASDERRNLELCAARAERDAAVTRAEKAEAALHKTLDLQFECDALRAELEKEKKAHSLTLADMLSRASALEKADADLGTAKRLLREADGQISVQWNERRLDFLNPPAQAQECPGCNKALRPTEQWACVSCWAKASPEKMKAWSNGEWDLTKVATITAPKLQAQRPREEAAKELMATLGEIRDQLEAQEFKNKLPPYEGGPLHAPGAAPKPPCKTCDDKKWIYTQVAPTAVEREPCPDCGVKP